MTPVTSVSGGDKMGQRLRELQERLARNSAVNVGVPAASGSYEDGTPLAVIAAVNEFGSRDGRIPERSFLRVPIRQNLPELTKTMRMLLKQVVNGNLTVRQMFDSVGERAVGYSVEAISAGIQPPNAPSTIRQKGSSQPLVDSGRLLQSLTYVVEEGGGDA